MYRSFDPYREMVGIMVGEGGSPSEKLRASYDARCILEDVNSPITRKTQEKLFQAVIDKGHIDFDDIPKSAGDISAYSGYATMTETLRLIKDMAREQHVDDVEKYADVVLTTISNLRDLSATFKKGFQRKNEYVMLEYNLYVYSCVEATTTLLYGFVDYVKSPVANKIILRLGNTRQRPNMFYLEACAKFNRVSEEMGIDYRKFLDNMINNGRQNFIGIDDAVVGYGAIALAAMAIVPISREIVYRVYNTRKNLSNSLELQAKFLEMNRTSVENNPSLTPEKRLAVVKKQERLASIFRNLASKIRVDSERGIKDGSAKLKKDNASFDVKTTTQDVENSAIQLF